MFITPSDIYEFEVNKQINLDFIRFSGEEFLRTALSMKGIQEGTWRMCKITDDLIAIGSKNVFDEVFALEKNIYEYNHFFPEGGDIEGAIKTKGSLKNSIDSYMEYLGSLECVESEVIEDCYMRLEYDAPVRKNTPSKIVDKMADMVYAQYGAANIEPLTKNSYFIKLFEGNKALFDCYVSLTDDVTLITFRKYEESPFNIFSGEPTINIHRN